jgi:membrane fusion protein (multidrug efflux system)
MNMKLYIFAMLGLIAGVEGCQNRQAANPANAPVPVSTYHVTRQSVVYYDSYPATTVAIKEVELRANVAGYITGLFFNEGSVVAKGQKLYEIDRSMYFASFQQAKDNVGIAEANLEKAKRDADRYAELGKEDAIARQRLDDAMTDLNNTKLQLTSAKSDLVKAETDLNYSVITAPFEGTIGISSVRMGTLVTPGQTLLNVISTDNPMGADIVIDENELSTFQHLEKKNLSKNDSTFHILLPDNTLYPFSGKISLIDRAVDPQTGTIKVRMVFPNPDRILKAGMNCNVKVLNENSGPQIIIPYRAVTELMGEYFVFVVDHKEAKQIKISIGKTIGGNIVVREGLNGGETIVTDGIQKLHNGSSVSIGTTKPGRTANNK